MWDSLIAAGGPNGSAPSLLRELGIYGGAQGIWVDKRITGSITSDGAGIAVGLLHSGSAYDDDLFEDGVIYHFPVTKRRGRRDASETAAIRNLFELRLPVFVITPTPLNGIIAMFILAGWWTLMILPSSAWSSLMTNGGRGHRPPPHLNSDWRRTVKNVLK